MLTACFSPSPEAKHLVTFEDDDGGSPVRSQSFDAGSTSAVVSAVMPSAPPSDAGDTTSVARPLPDASAVAPTAPDGATATPDAAMGPPPMLLFPSNCKAPWEETKKYHPMGYDAAKVHGMESNLNKDDCASCHGAQLEGCANSPSCNNCHDGGHPKDWRKNCIYCHGGTDNKTGAPPRDIDGGIAKTELSFLAHTIHVTKGPRIKGYDCVACHKKYEDALDPGHMYDDTPGKAEVVFDGGLSKDGMYQDQGRCANLYCHGDGKRPKATTQTDTKLTCKSCHLDRPTTGQHSNHSFGFWCSECHGQTINDDDTTIKGVDYHVNGKVDLTMPANNMMWANGTCTGTCHVLVSHSGDKW